MHEQGLERRKVTSCVLITGASGFIGTSLVRRLSSDHRIICVDIASDDDSSAAVFREQADLTDVGSVAAVCKKYSPDVVVHCAGIAHQKIGTVSAATYMRVNSEVTENLAKAAAESNPDVCFVFLSSVSVYGEQRQETGDRRQETGKTNNGRRETGDRKDGERENGECRPSSDYAASKLDAERRLCALYDEGKLHNLIILRLAPVYDREWSLNLDRRVFAPGKVAYLRFGSGSQRMSALARPNLVEFIAHILQSTDVSRKGAKVIDGRQETGEGRQETGNGRRETGDRENKELRPEYGNDKRQNLQIFNVCDAVPYEFNRIIRVFKKSGIRPDRPVISVPLSFIWVATRIAGVFFPKKREWIHSCYDKLACDLVFDNVRMMETGFRVGHSLETIFDPRMPHAKARRKQ